MAATKPKVSMTQPNMGKWVDIIMIPAVPKSPTFTKDLAQDLINKIKPFTVKTKSQPSAIVAGLEDKKLENKIFQINLTSTQSLSIDLATIVNLR